MDHELKLDMKVVPLPRPMVKQIADSLGISIRDVCKICGKKIEVMAFRGTGVCCELCRKKRDGDFKPGEKPL